jgi:hypothetical protein
MRRFDNISAIEGIGSTKDFDFVNLDSAQMDAEKNRLIQLLPYSYQRVLAEPRYSQYYPSLDEKSDVTNRLTSIALDTTLTQDEKKLQAMAVIEEKVTSLAPEYDPNATSPDLESLRADTSGGNFITDNKWWFIGGGVLIIGGIATWLILRKKK